MTFHEMLVSAGPVVLYVYVLSTNLIILAAILMLRSQLTRKESWADVDLS
jgi:prolipoprotein diacylglyceryltransferase